MGAGISYPLNNTFPLLGAAFVLWCVALQGAPVDFVHQVRPIFDKHCHS